MSKFFLILSFSIALYANLEPSLILFESQLTTLNNALFSGLSLYDQVALKAKNEGRKIQAVIKNDPGLTQSQRVFLMYQNGLISLGFPVDSIFEAQMRTLTLPERQVIIRALGQELKKSLPFFLPKQGYSEVAEKPIKNTDAEKLIVLIENFVVRNLLPQEKLLPGEKYRVIWQLLEDFLSLVLSLPDEDPKKFYYIILASAYQGWERAAYLLSENVPAKMPHHIKFMFSNILSGDILEAVRGILGKEVPYSVLSDLGIRFETAKIEQLD